MSKPVKKMVWVEADDPDPDVKQQQPACADEKKPALVAPMAFAAVNAAMHRQAQRRIRSSWKPGKSNKQWNYRPFCADLVLRVQGSGATATFYNGVTTLQPNNSSLVTEAAQFAVLFDEQRCRGITVHTRFTSNLQVIDGAWAVVFDVANAAAYTSVAGTLVSGQRIGPISFNFASGIVPQTKTGYFVHEFKTLNAVLPTNNQNELVGGGWFSSSDQNAIVGYLKYAADSLAGGAINNDTFIVFHMEYRERT